MTFQRIFIFNNTKVLYPSLNKNADLSINTRRISVRNNNLSSVFKRLFKESLIHIKNGEIVTIKHEGTSLSVKRYDKSRFKTLSCFPLKIYL